MTETNLLPCPFCGGEARLLHLDYDGNRVWGVFCGNDINDEYSHGHFIDNYVTETEAIEAWNTRAEIPRLTCELEETESYSNALEVIHVLECSECGETCEHTNGSYPRCPHCGRKVVER